MMTTDPIDQLIADGVTPRMLIAFHFEFVHWLAEHRDDTFRICYYGQAGEVVVEKLTAAGLVIRGLELGWTPSAEEPPAEEPPGLGLPLIFDQAAYHRRRGVHWYATAFNDTDECLPLALPARELAASEKRHERQYGDAAIEKRWKKEQTRVTREKLNRTKGKDADHRANHSAAVKLVAKSYMEASEILKDPITMRHAMTLARKRLRDCNDGDYTMQLARGARARAEGAQ